jgi:hypothetical protein
LLFGAPPRWLKISTKRQQIASRVLRRRSSRRGARCGASSLILRRGKGDLLEYRRRRARDPAEAVGRVGVVVTFSPRLRVVSQKGGRRVLRRGADGRGATPSVDIDTSLPTPPWNRACGGGELRWRRSDFFASIACRFSQRWTVGAARRCGWSRSDASVDTDTSRCSHRHRITYYYALLRTIRSKIDHN